MSALLHHTQAFHPAAVLLAHVLADPEAARWARVRVDPAWLGDAVQQRAWLLALDTTGDAHAVRARLDALQGGVFHGVLADPAVWAVWAGAWDVPTAMLDAHPVEACARRLQQLAGPTGNREARAA